MRATALIASSSLLLLALAEACSSSDAAPTEAADAGGVTTAEPTEPTPEASTPAPPTDAGACPAQDPSDPYCSALEARCNACVASMRPCEVDNLATCGQTSRVFTPAVRVISAKCLLPGCPAKGDEDCFTRELAAVPATKTQEDLAASFCAVCNPGGAAGCEGRFFFRTKDGGTSLGPGARTKMVNDTVVAKIASTCLPMIGDAGSSCEGLYFYCANQVMAGAFPKSACADAGK